MFLLRIALFALLSLALAACEQKSVRSEESLPPLLSKLRVCGMEISKATLIERPANERHIYLANHSAMTNDELECVATLLVVADYGLRSRGWQSEDDYVEAWNKAFRRHIAAKSEEWLRKNRPKLDIPQYEGGLALQEYARSVERICGAPRNYAEVIVTNKYAYITFEYLEVQHQDSLLCVQAVLAAKTVNDDLEFSFGEGVP